MSSVDKSLKSRQIQQVTKQKRQTKANEKKKKH